MTKNEKIIALAIVAAAIVVWYLLRRQGLSLGASASVNLGKARDDARAREDAQLTDPTSQAPSIPGEVWADSTGVYQSYNYPQGNFMPASPDQSYFTAAQVNVNLAPTTSDDLENLQSVGLPASTWIQ